MIEIVSEFDLSMVDESWPFAEERKEEIAAHWAALVAENPALWDGRVLGTLDPRVDNGVFTARLLETSFSAFIAWRDWGFPCKRYFNLFGSAVIAGNDGGYIFGVMGSHTTNAGAIYPCGGSLEPDDVGTDGRVDLFGSTARELQEETGLHAEDARLGESFVVRLGQLLSANRVFHFDEPTDELAVRIRNNIAAEDEPELSDVVVLKSLSDLDAQKSRNYAVEAARYLFSA